MANSPFKEAAMAKKAEERKKRTRYVFIDLDELDRSHDFNKAKVIEAGGFTELQARSYAQIKCGFYLKDWRFRPIPKALFEVMKERPTPHCLESVPEFARPKEIPKKELQKPLQLTPSPRPAMKKTPKPWRRPRKRKIRTNPNQITFFPE